MEESVRRCVCLGLCARVRERSFQGRLNEHLSLPLEISHGLCSLRSVIDITHPPPTFPLRIYEHVLGNTHTCIHL